MAVRAATSAAALTADGATGIGRGILYAGEVVVGTTVDVARFIGCGAVGACKTSAALTADGAIAIANAYVAAGDVVVGATTDGVLAAAKAGTVATCLTVDGARAIGGGAVYTGEAVGGCVVDGAAAIGKGGTQAGSGVLGATADGANLAIWGPPGPIYPQSHNYA